MPSETVAPSTSPIDWSAFKDLIDSSQTVVLTGHIRPDGDCVGSVLAFGRALRGLGKDVLLVGGHSVPPNLTFLDPDGEIRKFADLTSNERKFIENADLRMSLDASSWAQLGDAGEMFKLESANPNGRKAVLDHHEKGDDVGAVKFVDAESDSTGSLVFQALKELEIAFSPEIALPLFVAITTDSGWLRFSSVGAETFRRIAELVDAGVRPDFVYKMLYERESFGRLKLTGAALSRSRLFLDGKGIVTSLRQKDFDDAGARPCDSEDLVNIPLQTGGVEVALIAIEQKDGSVKASFRSRCELDCAKLASDFGGGGHRKAAGASLNVDLETACRLLVEKTEERYAGAKRENA